MTSERIGILHPGEMGAFLAASALKSGHHVYWASEGRSANTQHRAAKLGLVDAETVAHLCAECSFLVSICPPHAAEAVANQVAAAGFTGLYLDANAISPQRAVRMSQAMMPAGITFVDGGIIGGVTQEPGRTTLYLSGPRVDEVAACFSAGALMTRVLGTTVGQASAVKMCFSAYNKGSVALLAAILGTAESLGVRHELYRLWRRDEADFPDQVAARVCRSAPRAWRYSGEMEEIATTFREAGIPGDFHTAAAVIYRRLAPFKGSTEVTLEQVLAALLAPDAETDTGSTI